MVASYSAFGQCMARNGAPVTPDYLESHRLSSTGIATLDSSIDKVAPLLRQVYGITSKVYFVRNYNNSFADAQDHNIYLGIPMLQELYRKPNGQYMIAFVMAHEMGHIYQYQDTAHNSAWHNPNRESFELQADFLAGHVLCKSGIVTKAFGDQVYQTIQDLGDFAFYNVAHHGTPGQRAHFIELGISYGDLTYMANTLEVINGHFNPGDTSKTFNDQQIFSWAHLYKQGRPQFGNHDQLYFNGNGPSKEIFVRDSSDVLFKVGYSGLKPNTYSTDEYEIQLPGTDTVIHCIKNDFQKLISADGRKIGEFNLMLKYLSQGTPPPLVANLNSNKRWTCPGDGSPALCVNGNILYLTYRDHSGHIHLLSGNDVGSMNNLNFDAVSNNDPVIGYFKDMVYLAWTSDDRKSIVIYQVPGDSSAARKLTLPIGEGISGQVAMATYHDLLYIAYKNELSVLRVMSTQDAQNFPYCTGLGFEISDSPKLFLSNDDLYVGAKERSSNLYFQVRTGGDGEFFEKEELPIKNNSSEFAAGSNAIPELFIVEPVYSWIKNDSLYFISYGQEKPVILNAQASGTPTMAYPFIAFREAGASKDVITLAKIGRN